MAFRIGWFTSARDQAAIDLFNAVHDAIEDGRIKGEVTFVFSNREAGESEISDQFYQHVRSLRLPLICFSSKKFQPELRLAGKKDGMDSAELMNWRTAYDREIMARIGGYDPDIVVLAGYMLITRGEICTRYRMINLHPALPGGPTGTWQQVIWKLIEERQDKAGAMMHLVTEELDKGPPITYYTFSTKGEKFDSLWREFEEKLRNKSLGRIIREEGEGNRLFASIRNEEAKRELPLVVKTIAEFASGKLKVKDGRVIAQGNVQSQGYCLNQEVEEYLKNRT